MGKGKGKDTETNTIEGIDGEDYEEQGGTHL